ncbi:hypothetical protein SAMN02745191_2238 [Anaerorhabdus furcosa]|uniref:Uncharacterized protein n=1 Tax=Anaerorhabdus furcosa TaxID=118967 RepID=A0A1T4PZ47_9FIRM|nr:hypothetical protein SAMN02745191_2238 [Anaerorhabdus furcosa]
MDEFYTFNDFLPIYQIDSNEIDYNRTLFKAFELSYTNGLFQFAYIQMHMLFMVCIYNMLLKLSIIYPAELETAIHYMLKDRSSDFYGKSNTKNGKLYFGSFACISESDVFLLLKIVGMDSNLKGELTKLVTERNKYAHANGNITITSQETIDDRIIIYIKLIERVAILMNSKVLELYVNIIESSEFHSPDSRETYLDDIEYMREEFIKRYAVSISELNVCRKFDINSLHENEKFEEIKKLHIALVAIHKSIGADE